MIENRSVTILLVEDDQTMLEGIKELLEISEMRVENSVYTAKVVTAADGLDGLQCMKEYTPDLIISDINMPRMSGYQFLQELRKNSSWLQIPFIFLTAKGEPGDFEKGKLTGSAVYITKPFKFNEFLQQIRTQLHRSITSKDIQIQHIESLKKHILQILNHEFRTPLTYVTAYYEMLADDIDRQRNVDKHQGFLRGIQVGCIRLSKLVEDFLLIISLMSGEAQSIYDEQAKPIYAIDKLIQSIIDSKTSQIASPIQIKYTPAENLPPVFGIRLNLHNILEQLLDNAIKFSNKDTNLPSTVTVTATCINDELHISIKDTGIGYPAHVQNQIFDLFYQHERDTRQQPGTGIGLSIAKGYTELHGGRIESKSHENNGSVFTVILPRYLKDVPEHPQESNHSRSDRQKATILAVEDNYNLLHGLKDLLETVDEYEIEVMTALNGIEGLEALKNQMPDLIISDVMMPQMSGTEFLIEIRKNPDWLQIPVIFLTAKGEVSDKTEAFINGVDEYIIKPYDNDTLLKFVTLQLERRFKIQKMLGKNFDTLKQSILNLVTPNFRQPLSHVTEYTEKLAQSMENVQTDHELIDSLQGVYVGSRWLKRVIEDLMSLAELTTGEAAYAYNMRKQPIPNIAVFVAEFAQQFTDDKVQIQFKGIDFTIKPIIGDISFISDIIRRVIEVGVSHHVSAHHDSVLHVDLSVLQGLNEINVIIQFMSMFTSEVIDTIQRILARDRDSDLNQPIELGPNLHIAMGYVGLHNGHMVVSNDDAKGAQFTISLPQSIE